MGEFSNSRNSGHEDDSPLGARGTNRRVPISAGFKGKNGEVVPRQEYEQQQQRIFRRLEALNKYRSEKRLRTILDNPSFRRILNFRRANPRKKVLILLGEIHYTKESELVIEMLEREHQSGRITYFLEGNDSETSDIGIENMSNYQIADAISKALEGYSEDQFKSRKLYNRKIKNKIYDETLSFLPDLNEIDEIRSAVKAYIFNAKSILGLWDWATINARNAAFAKNILEKLGTDPENKPILSFAHVGAAHLSDEPNYKNHNMKAAFRRFRKRSFGRFKNRDGSYNIDGGVTVFQLNMTIGSEDLNELSDPARKDIKTNGYGYGGAFTKALGMLIDPPKARIEDEDFIDTVI